MEEVRRALAGVRAFHRAGTKSLREFPAQSIRRGRPAGPSKRLKFQKIAKRAGLEPEMARKARAFAAAYPDGLKGLIALCKRHSYPLGVGHVIRLLAVPAAWREAFLRKAAAGRWGCSRIDGEIRRRYPRRFIRHRDAGVGRRPDVPTTREAALAALDRVCFSWGRLLPLLGPPEDVVPRKDMDEEPTAWEKLPLAVRERILRAAVWERLPAGVQARVEQVAPLLEELRRAVAEALTGGRGAK